jgi:hypothetical protein
MIFRAQKFYLWSIVILANIMLAFLMLHDSTRVINPDGVLYLQTAQVYWKDGWNAAIHLYPWPFYSVLIAWVAHGFHCSMEYAAYSINVIFQTLTCVGFIKLASKTRGSEDKRWILFAAFIILFYPTLNSQRDLIARDFGYWAFSLWGWFYLICLIETESYWDAFKFNLMMLSASLFRLEGVIMLLLGPLAIFGVSFLPFLRRGKLFLQVYIVPSFIFVCITLFLLQTHKPEMLGRLVDFTTQAHSCIDLILQMVMQAKTAIATHVLTPLSVDGALTILLCGLMGLYFKTLIITLTFFYSLLVVLAMYKKLFIPSLAARPILYVAIALNIGITLIFLMQHLFVDRRYLFGLCLLLLLWVPGSLLWIYERARQERSWFFLGVLSLPLWIALTALHNFGPSKSYLRMAGYWIHNNLPSSASVYTNSPQVSFYAQRSFVIWNPEILSVYIQAAVQASLKERYDYLALRMGGDQSMLKKQLTQQLGQPMKIFTNEKGDGVLIFCLRNCNDR